MDWINDIISLSYELIRISILPIFLGFLTYKLWKYIYDKFYNSYMEYKILNESKYGSGTSEENIYKNL